MVSLATAEKKIGELEDLVHTLRTALKKHREEAILLTQKQFDDLGEYSCSLPTTYEGCIGMRWKRDINEPIRHHNRGRVSKKELPPEWWMGEYIESDKPGHIGIRWLRIAIQE
ncbi:MAG: hypothetical protein ACYSWP_22465 [Planctomycetota bacterium]|jgi:hypothetical protein